MAIYALQIKHKTKGQGASAQAHALYIAREGKYAERRAEAHAEYLTREGKHEHRAHELEASWSGNMPAWAPNGREFWEAADIYERANGRVYTEIVTALPRELSRPEREALVKEFVAKEIGDRFPYTVAIHNPRALDGGEQPHAHIMFSTRELDGIERGRELFFKRANDKHPELGGTKKSREWSRDSRENDRVNEVRSSWEKLANQALERGGFDERIDRRTLEAQGIDREPEPKMGPEVTQRLKRGMATEKGEKVIELREYRKQEREIHELEREVKTERAKVYDFDKEREQRGRESGEGTFRQSGKKRDVPEEEKRQYRRTVDLVMTRYEREDGTVQYRWKQSGTVAFVDRGDRITFHSVSPTAVKAGLQVAKEKGWDAVVVTGSKEFRQESWIQGQLMGMEVSGYKPKQEDLDRVEALRLERAQKKERYQERSEGPREGPGREKTREDRQSEPRSQESNRPGAERMKASEIVKSVDEQIKATRAEIIKAEFEQSGTPSAEPHLREKKLRQELDSLYRERYQLKQLGDREVAVTCGRDGRVEVDRTDLKRQMREVEKERSRDKSRGRGMER